MAESLDLSQRAYLKEYMDGPCSYEDLRACLRDLAVINRLTLAHRHFMRWLEPILIRPHRTALRIVDVGCGYGDMLRRIERWAGERAVPMELIGVDINPNAIRAAREATPAASRIQWVIGDACTSAEAQDADIVTSCGVMHHLSEAELIQMLRWMEQTAKIGWYITDLHRMPVPYRVFGLLMHGPWWHRFIRADGLASIRRSFLEQDWQRMCVASGIDPQLVEIRECRPARLCVGRIKHPE